MNIAGIFASERLFATLMASAVVPSRFGPSTLGMNIKILGGWLGIERVCLRGRTITELGTNVRSVVVPRCGVWNSESEI